MHSSLPKPAHTQFDRWRCGSRGDSPISSKVVVVSLEKATQLRKGRQSGQTKTCGHEQLLVYLYDAVNFACVQPHPSNQLNADRQD